MPSVCVKHSRKVLIGNVRDMDGQWYAKPQDLKLHGCSKCSPCLQLLVAESSAHEAGSGGLPPHGQAYAARGGT